MKEYFSNKTLLFIVAFMCLAAVLLEILSCSFLPLPTITFTFTIAMAIGLGMTFGPLGVAGLLIAGLVCQILPLILLALLFMNRRSASFASIGILVLSVLNMLFYGLLCLSFSLFAFLCLLYWAALVLLTVLLRRSRPGAPTTRSAIDMNNL